MNKEAVAEFERAKKEKEEKGERVEEKDKVRAVIPLESCLARLCQEEQVCDCHVMFCCLFLILGIIGQIISPNKCVIFSHLNYFTDPRLLFHRAEGEDRRQEDC